jgi:protease IV
MSELEPQSPHEDPRPPAGAAEPAVAATAKTEGSFTATEGSFVATPPRKRGGAGMFLFGAFSGCLMLLVLGAFFALALAGSRAGSTDFTFSTQKIAIITIEGEIVESRDAIELIHEYAESPTVKGIVVRINSPGGAIAPSQEIYSEILKTKKRTSKPFVASMDSVAASGGYYIAAACDEIVANPGSITGSIGVILEWMNVEELVRWAKMKPQTLTSGEMKAAGSPLRELTEAERAYLQRIILQMHTQFVRAVAAGRNGKISEADVRKLADGRVFTGEEAAALKLVDKLGTLHDAVGVAGKLAGIEGEPATIYPRRREPGLLELLGESSAKSVIESIANRRAPRFLYRW